MMRAIPALTTDDLRNGLTEVTLVLVSIHDHKHRTTASVEARAILVNYCATNSRVWGMRGLLGCHIQPYSEERT